MATASNVAEPAHPVDVSFDFFFAINDIAYY